MKRILFLALAIFAGAAHADLNAIAGAASQAASIAGSASNASQGNQQAINIYGAPNPAQTEQRLITEGTANLRTVPQVYAPPMGVTAPCRVAFSGGVSVLGVGAAGGGSVADDPCNLRELSRLYHGIGQTDKAAKVADGALALECQNEVVAKALGPGLCPVAVQPLPAAAPVAVQPVAAAPVCTVTMSESGIKTTVCR